MSLEPNARRRLHLVCATTRDPHLLRDLRSALEEERMPFVPSADLLRDVAMCAVCTQDAPRSGRAGLCDVHRGRWNLESCMADPTADLDQRESLQRLVQALLSSQDGGAQLLAAFDRQRRALRMVWEAHERGAVKLPESVAASVEKACVTGPRFLPSTPRSVVQHAS